MEALTQVDMGQMQMLNQTIQTSMVASLFSPKVMHHQDQKESVFLENKITTRKICVRANLLEVLQSRDRVEILVYLTTLITQQMQRTSLISKVKIQGKAMAALILIIKVCLQKTRRLLLIILLVSEIIRGCVETTA
jgi:hypothetical protein